MPESLDQCGRLMERTFDSLVQSSEVLVEVLQRFLGSLLLSFQAPNTAFYPVHCGVDYSTHH